MKFSITFLIALSLLHTSCKTNKNSNMTYSTPLVLNNTLGPQLIVYKTRADYSNNIPVTMNADRTKIVSYPAPKDVFYNGKLAKPTLLRKGYLLDNRGINEFTAFLSYSYEEYSKLIQAPSLQELMTKIVDKQPLKELIYCGNRTLLQDEKKEVDALIDNDFNGCKRLEFKY